MIQVSIIIHMKNPYQYLFPVAIVLNILTRSCSSTPTQHNSNCSAIFTYQNQLTA